MAGEAEDLVAGQSMRLKPQPSQSCTEAWEIPGELLVLSPHWKAERAGL